MKRIAFLLSLLICSVCYAQQRSSGAIADVVSLSPYTDEYFNTYYAVEIKNNTDKTITSIKLRYSFRNPYKEFDLMDSEDHEIILQLKLQGREKKFSNYIKMMPKNPQYSRLHAVYIYAVRLSDGSLIGPLTNLGQSFGVLWPNSKPSN